MEFPNGARIVVGKPETDDGDPDNSVWLAPYVRKVEGGYETLNIGSQAEPVVWTYVEDYESDELYPDFAFMSEDGYRVMCFTPTPAAQKKIDEWKALYG